MESTTAPSLLREHRFFQDLSDEQHAALAAVARLQTFPPGAPLFREGAFCDDLYLVCEGQVALEMYLPTRGQVRLLTVGPGELLGWSPLLTATPMTASAVALQPTEVLALAAAPLRKLCATNHDIGYALMRQVSISLAKRLLATRLQLIDVFAESQPDVFRLP